MKISYCAGAILVVAILFLGADSQQGVKSTIQGRSSATAGVTQFTACDNWTPINISTATTTKVISLASAKNVYICSFHLFSAGTQNAAWISGTKTTNECDTSTAGLAGGTTAATGYNFTAQTGIATSGLMPVIRTASTAKDVCIITSASVQLSGVVNWTQF